MTNQPFDAQLPRMLHTPVPHLPSSVRPLGFLLLIPLSKGKPSQSFAARKSKRASNDLHWCRSTFFFFPPMGSHHPHTCAKTSTLRFLRF